MGSVCLILFHQMQQEYNFPRGKQEQIIFFIVFPMINQGDSSQIGIWSSAPFSSIQGII